MQSRGGSSRNNADHQRLFVNNAIWWRLFQKQYSMGEAVQGTMQSGGGCSKINAV
jgi:hypothetical protein